MKIIIILLLIFTFNNTSYTQLKTQKNNGFIGTAGFGISFPDLKMDVPRDADIVGASFNISAGYLFNNYAGARLQLNYNTFSDYVFRSDRQVLSGSFNAISLKTDFLLGTFKRKKSWNLYGILGLGTHSFSQNKEGEIKINKDQTIFGINAGAGFNVKLYQGIGLCWEIQYNALFDNEILNGYLNMTMLNLSYIQ